MTTVPKEREALIKCYNRFKLQLLRALQRGGAVLYDTVNSMRMYCSYCTVSVLFALKIT